MEEYKVRLLDEATYLESKIHKLEVFIVDDAFKALSLKVRWATRIQLFFMRRYYFWLAQRVSMLCTAEDINYYTTPHPLKEVNMETKTKSKTKRKTKNTKTNG